MNDGNQMHVIDNPLSTRFLTLAIEKWNITLPAGKDHELVCEMKWSGQDDSLLYIPTEYRLLVLSGIPTEISLR